MCTGFSSRVPFSAPVQLPPVASGTGTNERDSEVNSRDKTRRLSFDLQWLRSHMNRSRKLCTPPRSAGLDPAGRSPEIVIRWRDCSAFKIIYLPRFYRGLPRCCCCGLGRRLPCLFGTFPPSAGLSPHSRRQRGVNSTSVVVSCEERMIRFEHRNVLLPFGVREIPE